MSAKKVVKSLAMGAVLAGVAALVIKMKDEKNRKKVKELAHHAQAISAKLVEHGQKMGQLTKSSYGKLVNAAVTEYRGVKELSAEEVKELKAEMLERWSEIKEILK